MNTIICALSTVSFALSSVGFWHKGEQVSSQIADPTAASHEIAWPAGIPRHELRPGALFHSTTDGTVLIVVNRCQFSNVPDGPIRRMLTRWVRYRKPCFNPKLLECKEAP